jgi:hypothetical protein
VIEHIKVFEDKNDEKYFLILIGIYLLAQLEIWYKVVKLILPAAKEKNLG